MFTQGKPRDNMTAANLWTRTCSTGIQIVELGQKEPCNNYCILFIRGAAQAQVWELPAKNLRRDSCIE